MRTTTQAAHKAKPYAELVAQRLSSADLKDLIVATQSALRSKLSDIENTAVASAPCDFAYTATSSWLPWMQMGPTPGFVVWAEAGKKLFTLEQLAPAHLTQLRKVHPLWFNRPEPWPEFTNMYLQHKARNAR